MAGWLSDLEKRKEQQEQREREAEERTRNQERERRRITEENQKHREERITNARLRRYDKVRSLYDRIESLTSRAESLLGSGSRKFSNPQFPHEYGAIDIVHEHRVYGGGREFFFPWKEVRITPIEQNTFEIVYVIHPECSYKDMKIVKKEWVAIDSVSDDLIESWIKWCASDSDPIRRKRIAIVIAVVVLLLLTCCGLPLWFLL